jgi:hypothetical protein
MGLTQEPNKNKLGLDLGNKKKTKTNSAQIDRNWFNLKKGRGNKGPIRKIKGNPDWALAQRNEPGPIH